MKKEWIRTKQTGQLFVEQILATLDIPIFFVCTNDEKKKYLCLCIDDEIGQYVVAEINTSLLIDMLEDKVPMEYAFRHSSDNSIIITEYDIDSQEIRTVVEHADEISKDLLPTPEAYLEKSDNAILAYSESLQKQIIKIKVERYCECATVIISKTECNYSYNQDEYKNIDLNIPITLDSLLSASVYKAGKNAGAAA